VGGRRPAIMGQAESGCYVMSNAPRAVGPLARRQDGGRVVGWRIVAAGKSVLAADWHHGSGVSLERDLEGPDRQV
jgi:hypothetical protein